jgi:hypothetical protein
MSVADLESFARVMPGGRLSKDNLHAVAVYLHRAAAQLTAAHVPP